MKNLDYYAAKYGQEMLPVGANAEKLENAANKALGILQENGIYAMLLFLYRENDQEYQAIRTNLARLLTTEDIAILPADQLPIEKDGPVKDIFIQAIFDNVLSDLSKTVFAKELIQQTLIYARHAARTK